MKPPSSDRTARLRALLNDRTKAAGDRALEAGGQVSELEELERLSRLVKLAEAAEPVAKKRWPVAAGLGATLLIVSLLLFARVPATEIELDLKTSEAAFLVPTQEILTESMNLAALGVTGLASIELPPSLGAAPTSPPTGNYAVRIARTPDGQSPGSVSLSHLSVPAGTLVSIRVLEAGRSYRIALRAADLVMRVGVLGPTEIGLAGAPTTQVDFRTPRSIVLRSGPGEVLVDLTPADDDAAFSPLLPVTQLALFRVDDYPDGERSVVRRVSAIQSGTLFLESLNGQPKQLRSGQTLTFDTLEAELRTLRLGADHVALQLHGRARGMRTGSGATERSLMPTWLDWLRARHGMSLLWGTTLYLFGIGAGVLRWWRRTA